MPLPTASDVHVNAPLTNISIAYMQQAESFMAPQVFPVLPRLKQSDRYFEYDRSYWYRREMKKRAPGTESAGAGFAIDNTPNYYCDVWALHKDVDDQIRANADSPISMDRDATEFLSLQAMLNMEAEFMTNYFVTSTWTGSSTGSDITPSTLWDASGGDPITDIDNQRTAMKERTGYKPNVMVVGADTWIKGIKNNSLVLDRIKHTQRGIVTEELVAALLSLDKVLVAEATENTAAEGAAESYSYMATKNDALLIYSEPNPGILKPTGGYIFAWTGFLGAGAMAQRIKRFRMEELASDRVEIEQAFDMKLVAADMGVYFDGTVS
jgi:hypothetical protein